MRYLARWGARLLVLGVFHWIRCLASSPGVSQWIRCLASDPGIFWWIWWSASGPGKSHCLGMGLPGTWKSPCFRSIRRTMAGWSSFTLYQQGLHNHYCAKKASKTNKLIIIDIVYSHGAMLYFIIIGDDFFRYISILQMQNAVNSSCNKQTIRSFVLHVGDWGLVLPFIVLSH